MRQTQQQLCPLCNQKATFYGVDHDNLKYFDCPNCTYYLISWRAEDRVVLAPNIKRQAYTRSAQLAPEDQVLLITIPPHSEDPNVSSEEHSGAWVAKSNYRL